MRLRLLAPLLTAAVCAQDVLPTVNPSPNRRPGEGEGPFDRLVIRGVTVIDGTGAQPRGPMDVVVEKNRIARVVSVGVPHVVIKESDRPARGSKEIDGA